MTRPSETAIANPDPGAGDADPGPAAGGARPSLPADPVQYDSVRNEHARKRGLKAPYIAGGTDPQLAETLRRERRYVRILIAMVVLIIVVGFGLGIIEALMVTPPA